MNRLAHYLKVLQREQLGTWKERADLERELNNWIRQYVADINPGIYRARRNARPPYKSGLEPWKLRPLNADPGAAQVRVLKTKRVRNPVDRSKTR